MTLSKSDRLQEEQIYKRRLANLKTRLASVVIRWENVSGKYPDHPAILAIEKIRHNTVGWFMLPERGVERKRLDEVGNLIKSIDASNENEPRRAKRRGQFVRWGQLVQWASNNWRKLGGNEKTKLSCVPIVIERYQKEFPEGMADESRWAFYGSCIYHTTITSPDDLEKVYADASSAVGEFPKLQAAVAEAIVAGGQTPTRIKKECQA